MPTDTQVCCLGCQNFDNGYCRMHKEEVEEQGICILWRGKEFVFESTWTPVTNKEENNIWNLHLGKK